MTVISIGVFDGCKAKTISKEKFERFCERFEKSVTPKLNKLQLMRTKSETKASGLDPDKTI